MATAQLYKYHHQSGNAPCGERQCGKQQASLKAALAMLFVVLLIVSFNFYKIWVLLIEGWYQPHVHNQIIKRYG